MPDLFNRSTDVEIGLQQAQYFGLIKVNGLKHGWTVGQNCSNLRFLGCTVGTVAVRSTALKTGVNVGRTAYELE